MSYTSLVARYYLAMIPIVLVYSNNRPITNQSSLIQSDLLIQIRLHFTMISIPRKVAASKFHMYIKVK